MTKDDLIKERNYLFNDDFSIKVNDLHRIKDFCKELTSITGIQVCNAFGYINELLPSVYYSCIA